MTSYSDYEENRGAGMFPTERAIEAGTEAYASALEFLKGDINDADTIDLNAFGRRQLTMIAHEYWNDLDFDQRTTYAQTNRATEAIQAHLIDVVAALKKIPPNVRRALSALAYRCPTETERTSKSIVDEAIAVNTILRRAIDEAKKNVNKRRPKMAVKNACVKLMELRRRSIGRDLHSDTTRAIAPGRDLRAGYSQEFRNRDAQFVYVVLRTIDPEVSVKTVGTSFDERVSKMRGK